MIHFLRGKITYIQPWELIIDVQNVGYRVRITLEAYEKLKDETDSEVFIHTRVIYRETDRVIYGFLNEQEVELFDFIRSLQGMGPQLSCNVVSAMGAEKLLRAIQENDVASLVKVPKIGKNMADKILFESARKKKKLDNLASSLNSSSKNGAEIVTQSEKYKILEQVEEALSRLGFPKKEIKRAEEKIKRESPSVLQGSFSVQKLIRLYLRFL